MIFPLILHTIIIAQMLFSWTAEGTVDLPDTAIKYTSTLQATAKASVNVSFSVFTTVSPHRPIPTRRPASVHRTARRQFQATGQPVSRTQASDAMTSRLPRYEAKCVQRRCFQCVSVPLRSDIKGTELPPANILIPLERQLIALQLCR